MNNKDLLSVTNLKVAESKVNTKQYYFCSTDSRIMFFGSVYVPHQNRLFVNKQTSHTVHGGHYTFFNRKFCGIREINLSEIVYYV